MKENSVEADFATLKSTRGHKSIAVSGLGRLAVEEPVMPVFSDMDNGFAETSPVAEDLLEHDETDVPGDS